MIASVGYHAVPKSGSFTAWKFKEGRKGSSKKLTERKIQEIEEAARYWGELVARKAFPGGPDLTMTLADMEEVAVRAARALAGSTYRLSR